MLDVDVKSIVRNLSSEIKFLQPLFESITNSLEANARNISIKVFESEVLDEDMTPQMVGFSITDDGDGFTEDNINSFCTLWSDKKIELGCKGSGRFTWLKVFDEITIISEIKEANTIVTIPFTINFSKNDVKREKPLSPIAVNKTTIIFKHVTNKYYSAKQGGGGIDKRVEADSSQIKNAVMDYLFITFDQLKEKGEIFSITISTNKSQESINNSDVPELSEKSFSLEGNLTNPIVDFRIKYIIKSDNKSNRLLYLCSNNRSSHKIRPASLNVFDKLPNGDSIYLYVMSGYLDELDTDDRQGLDYYASLKDKDELHYILYSDLLEALSLQLKDILVAQYPKIKEDTVKIIEEIKNEKPYLSKYLSKVPVTIASKQTIEKAASKAYEQDKIDTNDKFEKALENRSIDPEGFREAVNAVSSISSAELCEYILYRSKILSVLSPTDLVDKAEEYLHNIFMPKNDSSDNSNYLSTNMWILDDKFMSYLYVSSDLSIFRINDDISDDYNRSNHDLRRPDMFLAFDRDGDVYKNAVLVEFKKYSASLDEKSKALHELPNNIGEIRKSNSNIQTIWAYIITKLDDDFIETIENDGGYTEIFSNGERGAFYRYNDKRNAHIYICDIDSLVKDAQIRNKVFVDIIKK